jgi:hypothetical protein
MQWPQDTKGVIRNRKSRKDIWYLVAIVLSVLSPFTTSDYPLGIMLQLYCLSFLDLRPLITLWLNRGRTENTTSTRYQRGNQKS